MLFFFTIVLLSPYKTPSTECSSDNRDPDDELNNIREKWKKTRFLPTYNLDSNSSSEKIDFEDSEYSIEMIPSDINNFPEIYENFTKYFIYKFKKNFYIYQKLRFPRKYRLEVPKRLTPPIISNLTLYDVDDSDE